MLRQGELILKNSRQVQEHRVSNQIDKLNSHLIFEYFEYSKNSIDLPIGLMCIPNIQSDPRVVFSKMQSINAELKKKYSEYVGELSMGMSDDYEIALDYGATIIRVGSKIFT